MAPAKPRMRSNNHHATERQTDGRGLAVGEIQKPEGHPNEREIHKNYSLNAHFLPFMPAGNSIPEEKNSAHQAQGAQHILARRYTRVLLTAPRRKCLTKPRVILHEYHR